MSLSTVGVQPKYGLINKKKPIAATANVRPKLNVFSDDLNDDEDDTSNMNNKSEISRVNAQLSQAALKKTNFVDSTVQKALSEDPSCYDYDGTYDDFKAKEQVSHKLSQPIDTTAPKARYVTNLLATAKMREKEKDRIYEKKLLKERLVEDQEYGDKPKFMTTAYKNKLIEDKKWEYEDRLADEIEQRTDVRKSGMEGFYANLLTKNVAMGGNVDDHAVSVYTAGSNRQNHLLHSNSNNQSSLHPLNTHVANDDNNKPPNTTTKEFTTSNQDTSISSQKHSMEFRKEDYMNHHKEKRNIEEVKEDSHTSNPALIGIIPTSNIDNVHSIDDNTTTIDNNPEVTITVSKVEQILSARERYLARKRGSDSIS